MVTFNNLTVQVLEIQDAAADREPCAELHTRATISKSIGKSCHRLISLRPNRQFIIRIVAHDNFDWGGSNGFLIVTTFDVGDKVAGAEHYFVHPSAIMSAPGATAMEYAHSGHSGEIHSVIQHISWDQDQEVSFNTTLHEPGDSNAHGFIHKCGRISIRVHRCKFDLAGRRQHERPILNPAPSAWPGKARLDAEGIFSRVTYIEKEPYEGTARFGFKITGVETMATCEFHYRLPEEFQRLKEKSQREDHILEETDGFRVGKPNSQLRPATYFDSPGSNSSLASIPYDSTSRQDGGEIKPGPQSAAAWAEGEDQHRPYPHPLHQQQRRRRNQRSAPPPSEAARPEDRNEDAMVVDHDDTQLDEAALSVGEIRELRIRTQIKGRVLALQQEDEAAVSQLLESVKTSAAEMHTAQERAVEASRREIAAVEVRIEEKKAEYKEVRGRLWARLAELRRREADLDEKLQEKREGLEAAAEETY